MDSDELYDSLDEDSESQNLPQSSQGPISENAVTNNSVHHTECQEASTGGVAKDSLLCDIASVIPLYYGETLKERVKKANKNPSKKSKIKDSLQENKKTSDRSKSVNGGRGDDSFKVPLNFREQRTYSNIFHARIGRFNPNRRDVTDTARCEWGDETQRTDVSDVSTHFSDAKSTFSDTTRSAMNVFVNLQLIYR